MQTQNLRLNPDDFHEVIKDAPDKLIKECNVKIKRFQHLIEQAEDRAFPYPMYVL